LSFPASGCVINFAWVLTYPSLDATFHGSLSVVHLHEKLESFQIVLSEIESVD